MKTYNASIDWQWHLSQIRVGSNGKIRLPHISIDITKGCNMQCEHCSHLAPLLKGFFSKEELIESLASWSQKLQPKRFAILGGEPLLHPNFEEIVFATHQHWNHSDIVIISNGMLIGNLDDSVLQKIGKMQRIRFDVSQHIESKEWEVKFKETQRRFSYYKIPLTLRKIYAKWMVIYRQDENGHYMPYQSSPKMAWSVCECRGFYKIHACKLWYCSRLASEYVLINEGIFGNEWNQVLRHQPITLQHSQEKILAYLRQEAIQECSMCPDTVHYIKPQQILSNND